jgi:superfamily II DNA or RNA helicase
MAILKNPEDILKDISLVEEAIQNASPKQTPFSITPEKLDPNSLIDPDLSSAYTVRRNLFVEAFKDGDLGATKREPSFSPSLQLTPQLEEKIEYIMALNRLDRYVNHNISADEKILRDHQIDVFEDIRTALEQGLKSGYIKLPTGAGKTAIFCELSEVLGLKTLVVVPTKDLLLQTRDQMRKFATTIPEQQIGVWYSDQKDLPRQINITTYDSLTNNFAAGRVKKGDYDLVILDEAHVGLGGKRAGVIEELKEQSIIIGFTATPEYHADKTLDNLLDEKIHSLDAVAAIKRGILSPVSSIAVKIDTDLSRVKISTDGNYDESELQKAINNQAVNQAAIQLMDTVFAGKQAVAFCGGIQHAEDLALAMQERGLKADFVHGNDPNREAKLEALKTKQIDILCNADLLIAGFDCPSVSVCLNLAPTTSKVRAEQRGGRATRLDPNDDAKHAVVVDFIYQDDRGQTAPVLYSDVLGGQVVVTPSAESESVDRPEWLIEGTKSLKAEGIAVVLTIDELAKVLPRSEVAVKAATTGELDTSWTKAKICSELKITGGKFESTVDALGDKLKGQMEKVRVNGRLKIIYSENAFEAIKEKIQGVNYAPESWMTPSQLRLKFNISKEVLAEVMGNLREKGLTQDFIGRTYHRPLEHISPEGQKEALQLLGIPAPKGWIREGSIKNLSSETQRVRAGILDQLINEGHEHGYYRFGKQEGVLYISPKTNERINSLVKEKFSVSHLSKELGVSVEQCREEAKQLLKRSPESFLTKSFNDLSKEDRIKALDSRLGWHKGDPETASSQSSLHNAEYLTESGYSRLKTLICNKILAPSDWKTAGEIVTELIGQLSVVEKEAQSFLRSGDFGSAHSREYLSRKGLTMVHYSPELCEAIITTLRLQPRK